ncbi:sensor histidine kinase [Microbacterium sp. C5A9]|uniref:sensor histidine kinase n=1 Tax=Microbacterium sp. C5A9 TaxID=2736663 RepID=UPI001F51F0AC|nr:sensor histidine kinase [Microbacterium sp. C5A9]MCI1019112.1 sensor histidine kinase [Microbacterium sp. C5A9]
MPESPPASEVTAELPRPAGAVRRFWSGHPRLGDGVVAGAYLIIGTFLAVLTPLSSGVWTPSVDIVFPVIGTVVGAVALLFRRHRPWGAVAVFAALSVASACVGVVPEPLGGALALYAVFVYRSNRSGWIAFGVLALITVLVIPLADSLLRDRAFALLAPIDAISLVVLLIAALLGITVGDRRRYIGAILDRANQLARERDQQARLATLAERARITREIHDVVAHSLSVMVSLADGAGALAEKDPQRSRSAIGEIGDVGRQSLVEMRQLLGALGDDPDSGDETDPLRPNPGLQEIPALVATFRAAGLPVSVRTLGSPPVSPALQNAIHRIVQEALTNALRYAREPREVLVTLDFDGAGVVIDVTDDGQPGPRPVSVGTGRGLIGIRERVRLYEGSVDAGRMPGGGWRVHAVIPGQHAPDQEEQR